MMSLVELEKTIVECKKCERLVDFREKIAREKKTVIYRLGLLGEGCTWVWET